MENSNPAEQSFSQDIVRLFACLPAKRKIQLALLLILQTTSALSEVLSLGAIVPFLAALTNMDELMQNFYIRQIADFTGLHTPDELIALFAALFAGAIVIANILRFATLWAQLHLTAAISTDLGKMLFDKTLQRPYGFFIQNNSSDLIANTTNDLSGTLGVLQGILTIVTQGMITLAVVTGLLIYNLPVALALSVIIVSAFSVIMVFVKQRLTRNSLMNSDGYRTMIKALQEGFGGIRYILLGRSQENFVRQYEKGDKLFRWSAADNSVIRQAPRFFIEAIGVMAICALTVVLAGQADNIADIIPLLGFLGLASHRLLPAMQQVYGAISAIFGLKVSLRRTMNMLLQPDAAERLAPPPAPLHLTESLRFEDVWFSYGEEGDWTIKGLNFTVQAKTTIALVGHTGSGKSTVSDLVLGLLRPQKGGIDVDGKRIDAKNLPAWQGGIAHVPQHIFLTDTTIAENIAFGLPRGQIDMSRVKEAARMAQIGDFIETLQDGYDTLVGERGIRLSGGQLQRIGIARALYRKPSLIVFDEATSALDNTTEKEVMAAIDSLSHELTIILIAHRLSTVKKADNIFVFENGKLVDEGTYDKLAQNSPAFKELVKSAELD